MRENEGDWGRGGGSNKKIDFYFLYFTYFTRVNN